MKSALEELQAVIERLTDAENGCPWDKEQTPESLTEYLIEESHELVSAIRSGNTADVCEELGDVAFLLLFVAHLYQKRGQFSLDDALNNNRAKMVRRHPHVFGSGHAETSAQVEQNWEQLKLKEKGGNKRVLDGVPAALPSLIKAERIQEKAANYGFDWEKKEDVWTKVKEELTEVQAEMTNGNAEKLESEFGDFLFSLINAARLYKVNIDNALEQTNRKFIHRFNYIETQSELKGKKLKEMSLSEMDALWNEAKALEKNRK